MDLRRSFFSFFFSVNVQRLYSRVWGFFPLASSSWWNSQDFAPEMNGSDRQLKTRTLWLGCMYFFFLKEREKEEEGGKVVLLGNRVVPALYSGPRGWQRCRAPRSTPASAPVSAPGGSATTDDCHF